MVVQEIGMPTKTITLEIDAYEKLRRAKRFPRESFSEVVRRLPIDESGATGAELLRRAAEKGPFLDEDDFTSIDRINSDDRPPDIP